MTDEQLRLMSEVLIRFVLGCDWTVPYNVWGANVGQCRYCGTVGEMHYPDIYYKHQEKCPINLCAQLNESIHVGSETNNVQERVTQEDRTIAE